MEGGEGGELDAGDGGRVNGEKLLGEGRVRRFGRSPLNGWIQDGGGSSKMAGVLSENRVEEGSIIREEMKEESKSRPVSTDFVRA